MPIKYPEIKSRIQSTFIDSALIMLLIIIASNVLGYFENTPDWVRIALFILFLMYEPIFVCIGCTLGNYIIGIRVRKENDMNKKINFLQSFIRFGFKVFLGWISFLTIHSNPQKRAIHDFVSGSLMFKLDK